MWFLALWANPLVRKLIIGAAVLTAIFFAIRLYSNRVYNQGMTAGRLAAGKEIEQAKQAEWQKKEAELAAAAGKIETSRVALDAERRNLADLRYSLQNSLSQSLAAISASREASYADVARVPDADLDAALRVISANLAAAKPAIK